MRAGIVEAAAGTQAVRDFLLDTGFRTTAEIAFFQVRLDLQPQTSARPGANLKPDPFPAR